MTRWVDLTPFPRRKRREGGPCLRRQTSAPVVALGVTMLALLCGCSSVRPSPPQTYSHTTPPPPTFSAITAPIEGRGGQELRMLESGDQTPGAVLRCAYIEQEIGEYEESISRTNQVIFGAQRSDPEVEAIARWLRARAFAHEDLTTDSDRELRRARDMTRDPRLLAAIEKDLTRATAAPKKRPQLAIYSRDQWRAKNANAGNMKRMNGINRITIHHSATAAHGRSTTAAAGAIRGIQLHHQQTNGWGDIGYHYLIDTSGRVWIGRTIDWQGAHAGGPARNQHNVGICLLGNFTPDAQGEPPAAQMRAMEELIRSLCAQYDIPGNQVLTHRELRTTDCPGPYLQVAIQRLRRRLEAEHVAATTARPR